MKILVSELVKLVLIGMLMCIEIEAAAKELKAHKYAELMVEIFLGRR
jgi:hypothetical protein